MARVSPTTIWTEQDARKATSVGLLGYLTLATHWYASTDSDDQEGTFVLRDGRLFVEPWVISGGRLGLLGQRRRMAVLQTPTARTLDLGVPGASFTVSRGSTAAYLGA